MDSNLHTTKASSGDFNPPDVPFNSLLEKFADRTNTPEVIEVIKDHVYAAVGYGISNTVLLIGNDGLIVIDTKESEQAAKMVIDAFNQRLDNIFETRPVKAIIYTHAHSDHVSGAKAFAKHGSPDMQIICQEKLVENLFDDYGRLLPIKIMRSDRMFGGKFQDHDGYFLTTGLGPGFIMGKSGFLQPTHTFEERYHTEISGIELHLHQAPGESSEMLFVWAPRWEMIVEIGNFYYSFPDIYALRGSGYRNPLNYIKSIDKMIDYNPEHLVLTHLHPREGKDLIRKELMDYRDAIQYVHDQTVRYMNKGKTGEEIMNIVKLPPNLKIDPDTLEIYGQVDRAVLAVFQGYLGWFSGNSQDMFPMSPKEKANAMMYLAGDIDTLVKKAEQALEEKKWPLALNLAENALILDPKNKNAEETRNNAMLKIAEETYNAQTRNYILSLYLEQTGQIDISFPGYGKVIDEDILEQMPIDNVFNILSVNVDSEKCIKDHADIAVGLTLLTHDRESHRESYRMYVRNGIFTTSTSGSLTENLEFAVETSPLIWKNVSLGKLAAETAVNNGDITIIQGEKEDFYRFLDYFECTRIGKDKGER
jgi:alkyl sulfatase BDS1-like metallo-beta-lactamase superfamily hydrolase